MTNRMNSSGVQVMRSLAVILSLLITGCSGNPVEPSSYSCVADVQVGIGFVEESKSWQPVRGNLTSNLGHILKNEGDGWVFGRFGAASGLTAPPIRFDTCNEEHRDGLLKCSNEVSELWLNSATLRYQHVSKVGYVQSDPARDSGRQMPFITIGACVKLR